MSTADTKRLVLDEWRRLRSEHAELIGVSIRFSKRMTRTLGSCRFKRAFGGNPAVPFEVVISESLLACGTEQVYDTLRHEAAHAIAGLEAGHGSAWKQACLMVGAAPERCGTLSAAQEDARQAVTKPRFTIRCARCGSEDTQHSMTRKRRSKFERGLLRHAAGCGGVLTVHEGS